MMPWTKGKNSISTNCGKKCQKRTSRTGILDITGIDHGPFTSFKKTRCEATEKLAQILKICDESLAEPPGSIHHMDAVCSLILSSLEGLDLESHGYHRPQIHVEMCFQHFYMNLNHFKSHQSSAALSQHHFPQKGLSATSLDSLYFPLNVYSVKKWNHARCLQNREAKRICFMEPEGVFLATTWASSSGA